MNGPRVRIEVDGDGFDLMLDIAAKTKTRAPTSASVELFGDKEQD